MVFYSIRMHLIDLDSGITRPARPCLFGAGRLAHRLHATEVSVTLAHVSDCKATEQKILL